VDFAEDYFCFLFARTIVSFFGLGEKGLFSAVFQFSVLFLSLRSNGRSPGVLKKRYRSGAETGTPGKMD
jgi:hypothetical protein